MADWESSEKTTTRTIPDLPLLDGDQLPDNTLMPSVTAEAPDAT